MGKNFDQEHYDCDKCKFSFADEKNLDLHHCGCHEESDPNFVSSDVCKKTFECEKCELVLVDKTDLKAHMNRYHEVLKQCRFCPCKASLAEVLEHIEDNCEDEEKEVTNEEAEDIDEEGEISCNLVLVKCQVCAYEEVRNYISGYRMNFCDNCLEAVASADEVQLDDDDLRVESSVDVYVLNTTDTRDIESGYVQATEKCGSQDLGTDVVMEYAQDMETMSTHVVIESTQDMTTMGTEVDIASTRKMLTMGTDTDIIDNAQVAEHVVKNVALVVGQIVEQDEDAHITMMLLQRFRPSL